ncbi:MAG: exosortase/archaeosortase family protein [Verrucomicrobia bacterium]|nr:exosortase/archaeosortase family protein [Verrucomicrobiota bacterium]
MAEITPTNPMHNSEGAGKPVSSGKPHPPSLWEELLDTAWWLGEILLSLVQSLVEFGKWCGKNPLGALALGAIATTLVYFFAVVHPFAYGLLSTARWAWEAWSPGGDQSYGRLVPFMALGLFFYHRDALKQAPGGGYALGLLPLGLGILLFVLSVRCVNPRMGLASTPWLLFGAVWFVWGRAAARVILFPCAFLIFMIPVAALEQATSNLQFIITGAVGAISRLFGIAILSIGTTLTATDGSFNFEIAEGCSGIRSLMAMMMLTAVYVHLSQDRLWKKGVIFSCSLLFAIIGNIGRIFSIVLMAKYYDPKVAAGIYHENSGYLFFPIAIVAMLFFSNLVNLDLRKITTRFSQKPGPV